MICLHSSSVTNIPTEATVIVLGGKEDGKVTFKNPSDIDKGCNAISSLGSLLGKGSSA